MSNPIKSVFTEEDGSMLTHTYFNEDGLPEGGHSYGRGFCIAWQRGPLSEGAPNGAYLEEVLQSCVDRLEQFQATKFSCEENEQAIFYIKSAIEELESRTARRTDEGTEGTWKGNQFGRLPV